MGSSFLDSHPQQLPRHDVEADMHCDQAMNPPADLEILTNLSTMAEQNAISRSYLPRLDKYSLDWSKEQQDNLNTAIFPAKTQGEPEEDSGVDIPDFHLHSVENVEPATITPQDENLEYWANLLFIP